MQAERVGAVCPTRLDLNQPTAPSRPWLHWLHWLQFDSVWVVLWAAMGMVLRAWSFGRYPLREDEALYGYLARLIASGQDPMLEWVAVDKPPFFIYTLANLFTRFGATVETGRSLNLLCSLLAMLLLWVLAKRIYGSQQARWALAIFALSPFAIAFAPTLYTDPMLVAWLLLALVCASYGLGLGAGLSIGMAFATKQNALLFAPVIVGALFLGTYPNSLTRLWRSIVSALAGGKSQVASSKSPRHPVTLSPPHPLTPPLRLLLATLGFYFVWYKVWQWDGWRILPAEIPSFWEQSWNSYGGLHWWSINQLPEQLANWWGIGRWLGGWPAGTLILLLLVGIAGIVALRRIVSAQAHGQPPSTESTRPYLWDLLFLSFTLAYLLLHVLFSFQAWDRYLLGLAPLIALLAARGLSHSRQQFADHSHLRWLLATVVGISLLWGAGMAALSRLPVGGDHGAYSGIETVAAYLQAEIPEEKGVLYQRWLGWHWNWYLWEGPAGRVYWSNADMLIEDLLTDVDGYRRFIVFPGWQLHEREPLTEALAGHQLSLSQRLLVQGEFAPRPQFVVYEIVTAAP
ncbi:MAG: hypothetical protein GY759_03875 [Chloroflexi bacterium]|nr:hypothetical protein [Chloroflexota bacterium]